MIVQLSPFETQVMEVLRWENEGSPSQINSRVAADCLAESGKELFGPDWGGAPREATLSYPLLNRFLGRLQSKGLVYRSESYLAEYRHRVYGLWSLTPTGRDLVGLPAVEEAYEMISLSSSA